MATLVTCSADSRRDRSLVVSRAVTAGEVLLREDAFSLVYCDTNDDNNLDLALAAKLLSTGHDSHPTFASLHTNIESLSSEDKADLARDSKIVLKLLDASFSSLGPTLPIRAMNTLARVRINALTVVNCCDGKRSGLGMYCAAAMMNHDCDPSAGVWCNSDLLSGLLNLERRSLLHTLNDHFHISSGSLCSAVVFNLIVNVVAVSRSLLMSLRCR